MDAIFPVVLTLLSTVVTSYLVPWLSKKRKLAGAELLATVAVDILALVRANNPNLSAVQYGDMVARMLKERFKVSEAAAASIAAGAVSRAGIQ